MNHDVLTDLEATITDASAKVRECLLKNRPADAREYADTVSGLCYGRSCIEFEEE